MEAGMGQPGKGEGLCAIYMSVICMHLMHLKALQSGYACLLLVSRVYLHVCDREICSSLLLAESFTENHSNFGFPWGREVHWVQVFLKGHNLSCL